MSLSGILRAYPDVTIRGWYLDDSHVLEITSASVPPNELPEEIHRLGTGESDAAPVERSAD
jgi:hypothetical protein